MAEIAPLPSDQPGFSDDDVLYAHAWARVMSRSQWWLVAEPVERGAGWSRIVVFEPRRGTVYSLHALHGGLEAVRDQSTWPERHRGVRAALRAFRRPTSQDVLRISDLIAAELGRPRVQQTS